MTAFPISCTWINSRAVNRLTSVLLVSNLSHIQKKKRLQSIIAKAREKNIAAPEGRLRISVDHGVARYYQCIDDRCGEYISRENIQLPRQLAQIAYNDTVLKTAEERAKHIARCLKDYNDDEIEQLFTSLHPERQKLVIPVEPTFSQLQERWYSEPYVGKAFKERTPVKRPCFMHIILNRMVDIGIIINSC